MTDLHADRYRLVVDDGFDAGGLDKNLWLPYHLPHWSSRSASAARYRLDGESLRLQIEEEQPPWCPEFDGTVRVSSLQTGVLAGELGSTVGQHRFADAVVVREEQESRRLFTPQYGLFELRARANIGQHGMAALWMIGFEDEPERSAEICIAEIFGRNVSIGRAGVGMGVHPLGDPSITDDFVVADVAIDAREIHEYAAEWTPEEVRFFVDRRLVRTVEQSPDYPMQFMLGIYEFPGDDPAVRPSAPYPLEFVIERFRAWQR
jgi:Glycosyl hydrolases family 16